LSNLLIGNTINITLANQISVNGSYIAPTTRLNNGTLIVSSQLQTNLTINNATANIQTGGNITGTTVLNSGSLISNGTFSTLAINNGTFNTSGNGTIARTSFALNNNATLVFSGASLAEFGRVTSPAVTIGPNTNLIINLPQKLNYGNSLNLIENTGSSAISGTFSGLAQSTIFTSNGSNASSLKINYAGGTGNDLRVLVPSGIISVLTTNLTATANSQFASNLSFRVLGGSGNTTGIASVPFTITLPASATNCNIASGRFDNANASNRTITVLSDVNGNISVPVWAGSEPGSFQVNITQSDDSSVYSNPYMGVVGVAVQRQSVNRSFVRYLDVVLNSTDLSSLASSATNFLANFTLSRTRNAGFGGGSAISDSTEYLTNSSVYYTPVGFTVDFGAGGLGNQSSTATYDGVYELAKKAGSNLTLANSYSFHRLLGDANGDGVVDALDTSLIQTVLTSPAWRYQNASNLTYVNGNMSATSSNPLAAFNWVGDLNGDGKINALDLNIAGFQRGRRVSYTRRVT